MAVEWGKPGKSTRYVVSTASKTVGSHKLGAQANLALESDSAQLQRTTLRVFGLAQHLDSYYKLRRLLVTVLGYDWHAPFDLDHTRITRPLLVAGKGEHLLFCGPPRQSSRLHKHARQEAAKLRSLYSFCTYIVGLPEYRTWDFFFTEDCENTTCGYRLRKISLEPGDTLYYACQQLAHLDVSDLGLPTTLEIYRRHVKAFNYKPNWIPEPSPDKDPPLLVDGLHYECAVAAGARAGYRRYAPVGPRFTLHDVISKCDLLSEKEEIHLTTTLTNRNNSHEKRLKVRAQIMEANLRWVLNIARRYRFFGVPYNDIISEGYIGLLTAIDKFEPELGNRLSTYATWWIRQRILRYIINNQSVIRVPEHIINKINKLHRQIEKLRQRMYRDPTNRELAKHSRMSEEDVAQLLHSVPYVMSLESDFADEDSCEGQKAAQPLADRIPSGNDLFVRTLDELTARSLLRVLDDKERFVICHRFGLSVNQEDATIPYESSTLERLAQERGVSRERIRQIEHEALRKMKRSYQGSDLGGSSSRTISSVKRLFRYGKD